MALNIAINGVCTKTPQTHFSLHHQLQPLHPKKPYFSSFGRKSSHITSAKKVSSRTGRFDSRDKKGGGGVSTTVREEIGEKNEEDDSLDVADDIDDGYFLPELPGDKPDPFEGPQWDGLGFFVQYMWAFGVGFALIACGIAVATYNEGATDFKKTPVYQESIQSRELLEEPEGSSSDVFETNPTEEAPSLE